MIARFFTRINSVSAKIPSNNISAFPPYANSFAGDSSKKLLTAAQFNMSPKLMGDNATKVDYGHELLFKARKSSVNEIQQLFAEFQSKYGQELIQKFVDTSYKDGWTPLYLACRNNNLEVVELLIETGADLSVKDENGLTLLYNACENRNFQLIELLIKYAQEKYGFGTSNFNQEEYSKFINSGNAYGSCPLLNVCRWSSDTDKKVETIRLLIEAGADLNAKDKAENPILNHLSKFQKPNYAIELMEIVKSICDKEEFIKFINSQDSNGYTSLQWLGNYGYYAPENGFKLIGTIELNLSDVDTSCPVLSVNKFE